MCKLFREGCFLQNISVENVEGHLNGRWHHIGGKRKDLETCTIRKKEYIRPGFMLPVTI